MKKSELKSWRLESPLHPDLWVEVQEQSPHPKTILACGGLAIELTLDQFVELQRHLLPRTYRLLRVLRPRWRHRRLLRMKWGDKIEEIKIEHHDPLRYVVKARDPDEDL